MRQINKAIIHCSDSEHLSHDNYESIYKWHVTEKGWKDIGYHYLILKNGTVKKCRPVHEMGAHCYGQNKESIGICLTGKFEFSSDQYVSLQRLVTELRWLFGDIEINGHRDFSDKTCPNFEVKDIIE